MWAIVGCIAGVLRVYCLCYVVGRRDGVDGSVCGVYCRSVADVVCHARQS